MVRRSTSTLLRGWSYGRGTDQSIKRPMRYARILWYLKAIGQTKTFKGLSICTMMQGKGDVEYKYLLAATLEVQLAIVSA